MHAYCSLLLKGMGADLFLSTKPDNHNGKSSNCPFLHFVEGSKKPKNHLYGFFSYFFNVTQIGATNMGSLK